MRSAAFLVGCLGACAVAARQQAEQFILEKGTRSLRLSQQIAERLEREGGTAKGLGFKASGTWKLS